MGQVPALSTFLVIGDGRMATHLRRYFDFEGLPYCTWSRRQNSPAELELLARNASHALLLLRDGAIEQFRHENPCLNRLVCVHFSGSLTIDGIHGAHPLMTFSESLYSAEFYRRIPFILEKGAGGLEHLLPGLTNPVFEISREHKALYHALCVLSGNFTVILWEKVFQEMQASFDLPKAALAPYLMQTAANLSAADQGRSVLTGPLVRGDQATIDKHLEVLKSDPFRNVYQAFVQAYQEATHEVRA